MKAFLSVFLIAMGLSFGSVASAANVWKQVVNDFIFPNSPSFKQYSIRDKEVYQQIRVQVMAGDLRIANAFAVTETGMQWPLWQLNMDYRNGFSQFTNFTPSKLQGLRFDLRPLGNRPVNILVWIQ